MNSTATIHEMARMQSDGDPGKGASQNHIRI
jgi:hypothetical protein